MIEPLFIDFILSGIFFIKLLITTDQTSNLIISVVAGTFKALILSDKFGYMCITFMDLHFQSIDVLSQLRNGPSVNISFGSIFIMNDTVFSFKLCLFQQP